VNYSYNSLCLTLTFQLLALVANEGDPLEGFVSCS